MVGQCGCVACPTWQSTFGGSTTGSNGAALAVNPTGGIILAGDFASSINLGGGNINALSYDAFVGKLNADGTYGGWARTLGTTDSDLQSAKSMAIDSSGNVILVGEFRKSIDFGQGPVTIGATDGIYLVKFDSNGQHLWHKTFPATAAQAARVTDVTVDFDHDVIIVGDYTGSIDLGGGALMAAGGRDAFVAKFDESGAHLWSNGFSGPNDQFATSVANNGAGDIFVAGHFKTSIDFGMVAGVKMSKGGSDAFVVFLDPFGNSGWAYTLGDASEQFANEVAFDGDNLLAVTGTFQGTMDFGNMVTIDSATTDNAFVGVIEYLGTAQWAKAFGGPEQTRGARIAWASNGDLLIAGTASGAPDFGGGPRNAYGAGMYMARLDSKGDHLWSKGNSATDFGGTGMVSPFAIADDPAGHVDVGVIFVGQLDFGLGAISGNNAVATMMLLQLNGT